MKGGRSAPAVLGALVGVLVGLVGCKGPGDKAPPAARLGAAPAYRELAERQNARMHDLVGFYGRSSVEASWTDEHGERHSEVGEGNLIFKRPDQVALTFEKVGKTYLWIGGGPDRSWMFWGGDISRAYIVRNDNMFHPACEQFPIPLLPAELIDLYGVFELPLEPAVAPGITPDESRGAWVVETPARWCARRIWFGAEDLRPVRIELFDPASGRIWAASDLGEYREMEMRGVAPGRQPYMPTRVDVRAGDDEHAGAVLLKVHAPADVPAGRTEIKAALFDFDAIERSMRPDDLVVLDAGCERPAIEARDAPEP